MPEMYFEDFKPGDRFASPGITVTKSMIIEFALAYDPQPSIPRPLPSRISAGLSPAAFRSWRWAFRAFLQLGLFSACGMGSRVSTNCTGSVQFVLGTQFLAKSRSSRRGLAGPRHPGDGIQHA